MRRSCHRLYELGQCIQNNHPMGPPLHHLASSNGRKPESLAPGEATLSVPQRASLIAARAMMMTILIVTMKTVAWHPTKRTVLVPSYRVPVTYNLQDHQAVVLLSLTLWLWHHRDLSSSSLAVI